MGDEPRKRRQRQGGGGNLRRQGAGPTLARLTASRVLERVERIGAYADLALSQSLAQSNLSGADRRLCTELVYGTLRWRGRLDYMLSQYIDRGFSEVEPLILTTLRIGAYQLVFSDRIPATAAVDEAVRCTRALGADRAAGFVNAVLRRLATEKDRIELPTLERDPLAHLQHALSLPEWIAQRWLDDFGPTGAAELARASNDPPPHTIRVNRVRTHREKLLVELSVRHPDAAPCRFAPDGLVLGRKGNPSEDPAFMAGAYTVQDEASQLVVDILDPRPGDRVLDVCAAPGTKTTAIAERLGGQGSVLALDKHPRRLGLVARAARRLGLGGIATMTRDARRPLLDLPTGPGEPAPEGGARFDRVLVDAPCSGLGSLRRNPDARWRVGPEDPARLAEVQFEILQNAAAVVAEGGVLTYSTCTILREENEQNVERLLEHAPGFRLAARSELPEHLTELIDEIGQMHCYPHLHDCDGFFAARFVRVN